MRIEKEEYPVSRCTIHTSLILEYMLAHGSITHEECEAFTMERGNKCTVLRSRIPEIRMKLFWPVVAKMEPNKQNGGSHARYFLSKAELASQAGVIDEAVGLAAEKWREDGRIFYNCSAFVDYLKANYSRTERIEFQEDLFGISTARRYGP